MISSYKMNSSIDRMFEALEAQRDKRLDIVEIRTAMRLTVEDDGPAEIFHQERERMGVPDDGTSTERIRNLESQP